MSSAKKGLFAAAAALALAVFIYKKQNVFVLLLAVFCYSCGFTLLLAPLCARLERRGLSASLAAALSVAALVLAIALLLASFVPYLITHGVDLIRTMTPTLSGLLAQLGGLLSRFGIRLEQGSSLTELVTTSATAMTARLARGSMAIVRQTGAIGFALVIAYYLLRERRLLAGHLVLLLPLHRRTAFLCALQGCKTAILGYLSGMLKTSLFVGIATFAGLVLLGVRDALLLALFMGLFEVLPYIGPVLAAVPILLVTLPQGPGRAMMALAVVVLVQQVEGNFVSPHFTAAGTSLHPLAALVSVFVLGSLFGLWGILLAIPVVVTLRSAIWSARQMTALTN